MQLSKSWKVNLIGELSDLVIVPLQNPQIPKFFFQFTADDLQFN